MFFENFNGFAFKNVGEGDERIVAEIGHRLQRAADATIGRRERHGTKASSDILLDFVRAPVWFRAIIGKGHLGAAGEAPDIPAGHRPAFEPVPGIGAGEPSALSFHPFGLLRPFRPPRSSIVV